ncbi:MAG: futalosine hydrolase [Candidatus Methanoperedens sp.]|nr:futalosine hydrolase [Candidatus Methanoperedens sp.]MCE8428735.1 futalosine hydrolase [Candidatus Methanoperedens sp.]
MHAFALIAPTPAESRVFRGKIDPNLNDGPKKIIKKELYGKSILFTHCGIGKVNAAHSTTLMLENYEVDTVVLFGIAGGYCGSVGDVAVAETENYGEEGVLTEDGWNSMKITGFPFVKNDKEYYNTFTMDTELSECAIKSSISAGFIVRSGNFVTVSQCSGTSESGKIMKKRFGGICENMEGAAVAHICALYGIPMIEIRGISNMVEDRDLNKWKIEEAAGNCNKAIIEFIKEI